MKGNCIALLIGLIGTANLANGNIVIPNSLSDLNQGASLIIIGTPSAVVLAGASVQLSLQVSRVLKGDASLSGSTITALWTPASTPSAQAAMQGVQVGLWYFGGSVSGLKLLPAFQGDVPLSLTYFPLSTGPVLSNYSYAPTAAVSDKVAAELASGIESSAVTAFTIQLAAFARGAMDVLGSSYTTVLYQRLSESTSAAQQIIGISGLVRAGNASALTAAIQNQSVFASVPQLNAILLSTVRNEFRPAGLASIVVLGQAAVDSTNPTPVREAIAHALSAIHTVATLPYLATLFDDPDVNLRIEAIGGVGAFANGLPIQTLSGTPSLAYLQFPAAAQYMTTDTQLHFALGASAIMPNETAYLSYWKQWWLQHKTTLGV